MQTTHTPLGAPVALIVLLCSTMATQTPTPTLQAGVPGLVLTDVNVVGVDDAQVRTHQDVVVSAGRIVAVRPHGRDAAGKAINAAGLYVVPGLWDMHVHLSAAGPDALPLFVANGVLGVRDMGTDLSVVREWTAQPGQVAPRILGSGALLESRGFLAHVERVDKIVQDHGVAPLATTPPITRVSIGEPEEVAAAIDQVVAVGGAFVKARTYESPDVFFAIAKEARRRELPFAGHSPPEGVSWSQAVQSGMTSIEHMGGTYAAQLGSLSPEDRRAVFARMVSAGAFVDPNAICEVIRAMPDARAKALVHASAAGPLTYNPWSTRPLNDLFRRELAIRLLEKEVAPPPDDAMTRRQEFALLKELSANGVPVLAGTDLGSLLIYPGFSLHDELQALVEQGGLPTAVALRAATVWPARFFHATDWGRVAAGQRADLVVVEGNPLTDITMLRRIRGVVRDGTYYDRSALDAMMRPRP